MAPFLYAGANIHVEIQPHYQAVQSKRQQLATALRGPATKACGCAMDARVIVEALVLQGHGSLP